MERVNKQTVFRSVAYGGLILTALCFKFFHCAAGLRLWILIAFLSIASIDLCLSNIESFGHVFKIWALRYLVGMFCLGLIWNIVGTKLLLPQLRYEYSCFTSFNLFLLFIIQLAVYAVYFIVLRHCYVTRNHLDGLINRVTSKMQEAARSGQAGQGQREPLYPQTNYPEGEQRLSRSSDIPLVIAEAHPPLFIQNVKVCDICHGYFDTEEMLTTNYCRHTFHPSCLKENELAPHDCLYCKRQFSPLISNQ